MAVQIILVMFIVGIALGFVGAGGSGFIISILTVIFGFTIHVSLGTALAAMIFHPYLELLATIEKATLY
ncbi:hypothetical protein WY13_03311 [Clostridium ljungdahlii]|uniref:Sulfite exporter TauE/SafE family protein n=1 Tax=Clostridium ljungdahlii TaxID=1538 RepID=A0A168LPT9_9CLOT|nr:hypothetical protein WY13_03311 [Clostridium ljungdahlii]